MLFQILFILVFFKGASKPLPPITNSADHIWGNRWTLYTCSAKGKSQPHQISTLSLNNPKNRIIFAFTYKKTCNFHEIKFVLMNVQMKVDGFSISFFIHGKFLDFLESKFSLNWKPYITVNIKSQILQSNYK